MNYQKVIAYTAIVALAIFVALTFAPFVINGNLYNIQSPVPITVEDEVIYINAYRTSKIHATSEHFTKLVCNGLIVQYEPREGLIEPAEGLAVITRTVPEEMHGEECTIVGLLEYKPIPLLTLHHEWYSVDFELP